MRDSKIAVSALYCDKKYYRLVLEYSIGYGLEYELGYSLEYWSGLRLGYILGQGCPTCDPRVA